VLVHRHGFHTTGVWFYHRQRVICTGVFFWLEISQESRCTTVAREYGLYHNDHGAMRETFKTSKTSCLLSFISCILDLTPRPQFAASSAPHHQPWQVGGLCRDQSNNTAITWPLRQRHVRHFRLRGKQLADRSLASCKTIQRCCLSEKDTRLTTVW
jgi:hypothetical protein